MYTICEVSFPGDDATYEIGADVDADYDGFAYRHREPSYQVGEPDVSAPDCELKLSRLVDTDTLPKGWSEIAEERLIEAYEGKRQDDYDAAGDYAYDATKDEELEY